MCGAFETRRPSASNNAQGEIEALSNIDRNCCVLQDDAHLLGDVHEQAIKNLEAAPDRVSR